MNQDLDGLKQIISKGINVTEMNYPGGIYILKIFDNLCEISVLQRSQVNPSQTLKK